jgi:hypothetical protein
MLIGIHFSGAVAAGIGRGASPALLSCPRPHNLPDAPLSGSPDRCWTIARDPTSSAGCDRTLIRPGRCFGTIEVRALTYAEACAAARDAGLPTPEDTGRLIVLADLFNPRQSETVKQIAIGIGR